MKWNVVRAVKRIRPTPVHPHSFDLGFRCPKVAALATRSDSSTSQLQLLTNYDAQVVFVYCLGRVFGSTYRLGFVLFV